MPELRKRPSASPASRFLLGNSSGSCSQSWAAARKSSIHTAAVVVAATGQTLATLTVEATPVGYQRLLQVMARTSAGA
jgi:hypothetical protein